MSGRYSVIFRTGGTDNFKWNLVGDVFTRETATVKVAELERIGYRAMAHDAKLLASIGMPESYE